MEDAFRKILQAIDPDPDRPELQKTPERTAKSLMELTSGNRESLDGILDGSTFEDPSETMVLVKDITFFSLCEHHLLPFYGKAHVAYVPDGKLIGLSKIPRVVEHFARRLQVQERLTDQIASALEETIQPRGLGVVVEATHLCMVMRGIRKMGSVAVTSCLKGSFLKDARTRSEFLSLVHADKPESIPKAGA